MDGSDFTLKNIDVMVYDIFQVDSLTFNKTVDLKKTENYYT